jgi:hypothetical protein
MMQYEGPKGEPGPVRELNFRATANAYAVLGSVEGSVRQTLPEVEVYIDPTEPETEL